MSVPASSKPVGYDVATALWQGNRAYQEDTLLADFHGGMNRGFAVLADGMGGHAAGDLASRLVVIDAASHLKFLMHDGASLEANLHAELTSAIITANDVLKDRAADDNRLSGMGTTFLATVMFEDRLYWASVGDSPLYLWREGTLRQINADHSMAPVIDQMAKAGEISAEEAANHPDRNALTSVLMGGRIKSMDVPKVGMVLDPGDVLIQSSDGLQYIDNAKISDVLSSVGTASSSRDIADALMGALRDLDDPLQDNVAILVLQLSDGSNEAGRAVAATRVAHGERAVTPSSPAPAPTSPTPSSRRWIAPAALIGGAAVVAGLYFGLPEAEPDAALATAEPAVEAVVDPVADAPIAEPSVVAGVTAADDIAPDVEEAAPATADAAEADIADVIPQADAPAVETAGDTEGTVPADLAAAQADTADGDTATVDTTPPVGAATILFGDTAPAAEQGGVVALGEVGSGSIGIGVLSPPEETQDGGAVARNRPNPPADAASLIPQTSTEGDARVPNPAQAPTALVLPGQDVQPTNAIPGVGPLREGLEAISPDATPFVLPERQQQQRTPQLRISPDAVEQKQRYNRNLPHER